MLDYNTPNLVVLNGDLITGENTFLENSTDYINMLITPMAERSLTWASMYGNHNHQPNILGTTILKRERMYPGSRMSQMVDGREAGVSNHYLPVYPSNYADVTTCAPSLLLWFFDSRGGYM